MVDFFKNKNWPSSENQYKVFANINFYNIVIFYYSKCIKTFGDSQKGNIWK